jgi:DNA invertase Pin-like site-specific DNA recombinase
MIRVRCYYRYSSDEQSDGWSIEAQDKACRAFIASRPDWQHIGQPYIDEAWSGKTVNRPAFQQMLQDARSGQFDVIVCHKLDRFSRSLVDVLLTLDELQKYNVTFASATESIDFTSPSGRMMLVMLAFFAQWYVENLSAETTKGKKERFDQGLYNGDLRFGYSKDEDGKPTPNSDAEGVRLAYQWCAQGKTDAEIATLLNQAGYRTYRLIKNNRKKATPETDPKLRRPWTKDSVASLLRAGQFYLGNTEYIGEGERKRRTQAQQRGEGYAMQKQLKMGTHPTILSEELYKRAVAARLQRVRAGKTSESQVFKTYLLGAALRVVLSAGTPCVVPAASTRCIICITAVQRVGAA